MPQAMQCLWDDCGHWLHPSSLTPSRVSQVRQSIGHAARGMQGVSCTSPTWTPEPSSPCAPPTCRDCLAVARTSALRMPGGHAADGRQQSPHALWQPRGAPASSLLPMHAGAWLASCACCCWCPAVSDGMQWQHGQALSTTTAGECAQCRPLSCTINHDCFVCSKEKLQHA